jgi:hypothetical protein
MDLCLMEGRNCLWFPRNELGCCPVVPLSLEEYGMAKLELLNEVDATTPRSLQGLMWEMRAMHSKEVGIA